MIGFVKTRPDEFLARLEVSSRERMTITDDSLSNEPEREPIQTAVAICAWQVWKILNRGEQSSAFTDAFGKIGPVFGCGHSGHWRNVSQPRSTLKPLPAQLRAHVSSETVCAERVCA